MRCCSDQFVSASICLLSLISVTINFIPAVVRQKEQSVLQMLVLPQAPILAIKVPVAPRTKLILPVLALLTWMMLVPIADTSGAKVPKRKTQNNHSLTLVAHYGPLLD